MVSLSDVSRVSYRKLTDNSCMYMPTYLAVLAMNERSNSR